MKKAIKNNLILKGKKRNHTKEQKLKKIIEIYLITRIILIIFMLLGEFILSNKAIQYHHVFELFDNEHYLNIANKGYTYMYELAFFPLTPLLIRYLGKIGFIILNQICVILSAFLLYLISDKILNKENKYFASILFLVSPISIFTCMFYSEAIFIFLTLSSYYLYKTKKNYLVLGITLGLSIATRSIGSMLFFAIFIFMLKDFLQKKEKSKNILITYILATIISCIYPIYLYIKTNNPLYFVTVQFEYWNRVKTNIFTILIEIFKPIISSKIIFYYIDYIILLGTFIYIIINIIKHKKEKKYYELYLYLILSLISICSTRRANADALTSFYRYIYACFPIYLIGKKSYIIFLLTVFLSAFITIIFSTGVYFY